MKKTLVILALALTTALGYSQGTVNFNNRVLGATDSAGNPAPIDAPISYAAGTQLGGASGIKVDGSAHGTAQVALYGGPLGTPEDQLVLLVPAVSFRSGTFVGYANVGTAGSRLIAGTAPGGSALVQLRAWDTVNGTTAASYEAALGIAGAYIGKSALIRVDSLGGGVPAAPAANILGLQSFSIAPVPEPGTIALGFLGLGSIFLLRRKK